MQKDDEIWELKPGEGSSGPSGEEKGPGGEEEGREAETPQSQEASASGGKPEETEKKKEPGRIDMDEILDLKPDEEGGGESEAGGKKDELELVDIGDKKPEEEPESVVPTRKEEKSIDMEKPQVLEPDEKKGKKGPAPELQGGEGKKFERQQKAVSESAAPAAKSGLLTIWVFAVLLFLGGSVALLVLPFFGIETIPDELPVLGQIIEFYRNLPIFPD